MTTFRLIKLCWMVVGRGSLHNVRINFSGLSAVSPLSTFSLMTSNLAGVNYELFAWEEAGGWRGRTQLWRPGHLTMDIRLVFLNLSPALS